MLTHRHRAASLACMLLCSCLCLSAGCSQDPAQTVLQVFQSFARCASF